MHPETEQRRPIEVENAPADLGLTKLQARQRALAGWDNAPPESAGKSDRDIILGTV